MSHREDIRNFLSEEKQRGSNNDNEPVLPSTEGGSQDENTTYTRQSVQKDIQHSIFDQYMQHRNAKTYPLLYKKAEEFDTSRWEYWTGYNHTYTIKSVHKKGWPDVNANTFSKACEILTNDSHGVSEDQCLTRLKDLIRPKFILKNGQDGLEGLQCMPIKTSCDPECIRIMQSEWQQQYCIHLCFLVDGVVTLVGIEFEANIVDGVSKCGQGKRNTLFCMLQDYGVLPKSERHYRNALGVR